MTEYHLRIVDQLKDGYTVRFHPAALMRFLNDLTTYPHELAIDVETDERAAYVKLRGSADALHGPETYRHDQH